MRALVEIENSAIAAAIGGDHKKAVDEVSDGTQARSSDGRINACP